MKKDLVDIKHVREQEESELNSWEDEINKLKSRFEKIDDDLFSKVE